jgi:hypothetical protein
VQTSLFSLLFLIISFHLAHSQKYVLIEKAGNPHTERIAMYDELTFQLRDDKVGWITRTILDMDPNGQMIMLGDVWIQLKDIERIKLKRKRALPTILGGALQVGGLSMFMGDLAFTISGEPQYSEGGMEFGLINFAVGTGIRMLFEPIVYNLGKQKRLRVVDLTF